MWADAMQASTSSALVAKCSTYRCRRVGSCRAAQHCGQCQVNAPLMQCISQVVEASEADLPATYGRQGVAFVESASFSGSNHAIA